MSTIRRQSIISSIVVYIGFALGFLNTYLFTKEGSFTAAQFGLTNIFIAIATVMYSFSNLGVPNYVYKFFPFYRENLEQKENDMFTWSLVVSLAGFLMIMIAGYIFKDYVIEKYGTNSPDLIRYYYLLFPFGFGLTFYQLLEGFAWQVKKPIITNFLREVLFRLLTTLLIVLSFVGVIHDFDLFIKLYALTYLVIALVLLIYMIRMGKVNITFTASRVTQKFKYKIITYAGFVWSGSLVHNISQVFDSLVIGSVLKDGLSLVAIYSLAQNMSSLIQAPQRAILSSALPALSDAWKQKDIARIDRIYHRSSINQLLFAVGMFVLIWINFIDGITTFNIQGPYREAQHIFLYIGLMRIIDLGTGLNAQIISTSNYWRFEFGTGIILILITLPLNYILTKTMGVTGPAIANLVSFTIYNAIRYFFLLKKYNMQPFTIKSLYALLLALGGYLVCHWLFDSRMGIQWIILRSTTFMGIFIGGALALKISPDILPVWETMLKKVRLKK